MRRLALLLTLFSLLGCAALFIAAPPAISRLLLLPTYWIARGFRLTEGGAEIVVEVALGWLLWSGIIAALVLLIRGTIWRSKLMFSVCAVTCVTVLFLQARGQKNAEFEGTWEVGFERSDFFPASECWRPRYWLVGAPLVYGNLNVGHSSPAVRIRFIGNTSAIGTHGHLGNYLREVQVVRVLEMSPAQPCQ